jgi:hypothetical protein
VASNDATQGMAHLLNTIDEHGTIGHISTFLSQYPSPTGQWWWLWAARARGGRGGRPRGAVCVCGQGRGVAGRAGQRGTHDAHTACHGARVAALDGATRGGDGR